MGQKPTKGGGKTANNGPISPRSALMKHHAKNIGKASAHRTNPQIASQWAEARFNCLTNFVHDEEEDSITINKDNFNDPLQAGIFDYIASGKKLGSKSHSMNKKQFMEAMSEIAKYNEEDMAQFIVEAMLFIYNRTNRLHPDTVDANTIASLMNDVQNNYPEVLLRDGKLSPNDINLFFEQHTGKKTGSITKTEAKKLIKKSMKKKELTLIDSTNKPHKAPHLHPSPRDKGWLEEPFDEEDDSSSGGESDNDNEDETKTKTATTPINQSEMYTVTFAVGSLGMTLNTSDTSRGCFVNKVVPDSQAAKANVCQGHQIIKIDELAIFDATQAMQLLKTKPRPINIVFKKHLNSGSSSKSNTPIESKAPSKSQAPSKSDSKLEEKGEESKESKETVQKKVLIMRKIRDKKLEMTQTSDPNEKIQLQKELEGLIRRLKAVSKPVASEKEGDGGGKTNEQSKKTPATSVIQNNVEDDGETYTMKVVDGPIGLGLVPKNGNNASGVIISKISPGSQAEQVDEIGEGDYLIKINATNVRTKNMADIMELLKTTKRPFVLTFELGEESDSD